MYIVRQVEGACVKGALVGQSICSIDGGRISGNTAGVDTWCLDEGCMYRRSFDYECLDGASENGACIHIGAAYVGEGVDDLGV